MNKAGLLFMCAFLLVCCSDSEQEFKGELTSDYVKDEIKASMTYNQLVHSFGEPKKDLGSGIHIYVYKMSDATEIWIGFTDHILYANHMSENEELISTII